MVSSAGSVQCEGARFLSGGWKAEEFATEIVAQEIAHHLDNAVLL